MSTKRFIAKHGLDNNNQTITNVANPINGSDAVNKNVSDVIYDRANTAYIYASSTANNAYNTANNAWNQANSAYNKANSVYTETSKLANSAYDRANTAYSQANDSYIFASSTANNAYITANNAWNASNTANTWLQANDGITLIAAKDYANSNDSITLASAKANDYNTLIAAYANDSSTLASAKFYTDSANNWLQANDVITLAIAKNYANLIYSYTSSIANDAYNTANSAWADANVGISIAQAAYDAANNVAPQIAPAHQKANAAYATANNAWAGANASYTFASSTANNAYITANNAWAGANVSHQKANAAYSTANSAWAGANASYTFASSTANNAYNTANNAYNTANNAWAGANASYTFASSTANNAYITANNAWFAANASHQKANAAYSTANSAWATANASYTFASSTANNAYITANNAWAGANNSYTFASSTANNAYNTANNAWATANSKLNSSGGIISGSLSVTGNVQIDGTLSVSGNVFSIQANNLSITDNMIYLNRGANTANPDIGITAGYNDGIYHHTGFFRDATDGIWKVFDNYAPEPDESVYIDTSNNTFRIASFQANTIYGNTFITSAINGIAPFVVSSTTLVSNLNVDYLDNNHGSYYSGLSNTAFDRANTAYSQANASYTFASSTANNAYNTANSAWAGANASHQKANAAYSTANSAWAGANASYTFASSTANNAYNTANSAWAGANASYTFASSTANNAYITANNALACANASHQKANAAYSTANSAWAGANASYTFASSTANNAYITANNAWAAANTANTYRGNATNLSSGTIPGDRGVTAGSTTPSFIEYNGTTKTAGQFDGGSTAPTNTNRLNYDGNLYATTFFGAGTGLTGTASNLTANVATYEVINNTTSGIYYPQLISDTNGNLAGFANNALAFDAGTGSLGIGMVPLSGPLSGGALQVYASSTKNYGTFDCETAGLGYLTFSSGSNIYGYIGPDVNSIGEMGVASIGDLIFATDSVERLRINSSGNVGIGTTPSAWNSSYKAVEIGNGSIDASISGSLVRVASNAYLNDSGQFIYRTTGTASAYTQNFGSHQFFTVVSGTAGAVISPTLAMTLTLAGNLGIGVSSPSYKLDVNGTAKANTLALTANTASTNTTTGTLIVTGGAGVSGNVYATTFFGAGTGLTGTASSLSIGGSSGSVGNAVTFNNGGSGAASGTTFNGSTAVTISHNSIGALALAGGTLTGQLTSTLAWNAATGSGQIYINGATGNRIDFNTNGVGAPAFTTRSAGTKIVLYPNVGASSVDFALGIENNNLWFSTVDNTNGGFKWYHGTTNTMSLLATGILSVVTGFRINNAATSGQYLRGNGTNFVSSAIQAADVPTLNQNTTGSAGSVAWSGITSKPTTVSGYGITNALVRGGAIGNIDFNAQRTLASGIYSVNDAPTNGPPVSAYSNFIQMYERGDTAAQLVIEYSTGRMYSRGIQTAIPTYSPWRTQIDDGNYTSYAMPAGSSATNSVDVRAPIFYDYNDTGYYINAASTSSTNHIIASRIKLTRNYGHSVFGVYDSTRYQGVWSMGESWYLPDDGTNTGNLYGLAWSHPNAGGVAGNLNDHGLLVLVNGGFRASVTGSIRCVTDMRSPLFYDYNNTAYYVDPNGTSQCSRINCDNMFYGNGNFSYFTGFYDTNDTAYFVDPNSVSHLNDCRANVFYLRGDTNNYFTPNALFIRGASPTIYFRDTDANCAMLHNNSNLLYILRGGNDTTTWTTVGSGSWPMTLNLTNNDVTWGGNISAIYNVTAYASDKRLKENIKEIPNAIEKIKKIRGVTFDWNDLAEEVGFTPENKYNDIGVIAQEIEEVLPQVITLAPFDRWTPEPEKEYSEEELSRLGKSKSGEDYKTVQYDRIVPLLIQGIKEQQNQIDKQQETINKLKLLLNLE